MLSPHRTRALKKFQLNVKCQNFESLIKTVVCRILLMQISFELEILLDL